ncbi:MAG: ZIP family metal transporter [Erysipelotrichaceae bacterium]|nr:ZIP family metal transporter [Erysipelotrichaceae bacterium]
MSTSLLYAFLGTLFPFLLTTIGAGMVIFMRRLPSKAFERLLLGFASGVMIASSIWSLLIPAINSSQQQGSFGWLVASIGFLSGGCFLLLTDYLLEHLPSFQSHKHKRTFLFIFAVTMHNIPEGMAVGVAFALAIQGTTISLASAIALSIGIALQNLPEGMTISLPLFQSGYSKIKAFFYGSLTGIVEPIAGTLTVFCFQQLNILLPFLLSFAAGAMIYVVCEELIPEKEGKDHCHKKTIGVMIGFTIMMILDVALA